MSIKIDINQCNGCGSMTEGRCMMVCPGDLLFKDSSNRCRLRDSRDCWDCAACMKECPRQAIEMYLPAQIGGRGSLLKARVKKDKVVWTLIKPDGDIEDFEIVTRTI